MKFLQSKSARLAQLDKEVITRLQEVSKLLRPGDVQAYLYVSNLAKQADMVAAATGTPFIIAGLLSHYAKQSPNMVECLKIATGAADGPQTAQVKTLDQWNATELSLTEFLQPGDEVDEAIYDHMAGVVPPQYLSRTLLQAGEAEYEREGVYYYLSFQVVGEKHVYLGSLPEFKQPD